MLPAVEVLQKGGSFALIAHIAPDGDTIGSCLALAHLLIEQGKSVELYCHDRPPESLKFLDGIQYFKKPDVFNSVGLNNYEKGYTHYDAVICLDCSDAGRLGDAVALFNHTACTINIDHHATNTMYANINIVEPRASSTAELIFDLIKAMNKNSFSVCICEALYTGIVTDTGGFGFSNTTPAAHRIAAELIGHGVDVDRLTRLIFKNTTLARVRLLAKVLDSLETYFDDRVAFLTVTRTVLDQMGVDDNSTDGMINYAIDIIGIECAVLFKEMDNSNTKVGIRTKGAIDASHLAVRFGGGGHIRAAGCVINEGLNKSKTMILEVLKNMIENDSCSN